LTSCRKDFLKELNIPPEHRGKPILKIGNNAFKDCTNLTSVSIPDSVTVIGDSAFENCTNLREITISKGVTTIGNYTFSECSKLSTISIPNTVIEIGSYAFYRCEALSIVNFNNSFPNIRRHAFYDCTKLKEVHVYNVESWCKTTFETPESNPLYYANNLFINRILEETLIIPDTINSIDPYVFYKCMNIKTVVFTSNIQRIDHHAFFNCWGIKNIFYTGSEIDWDKISIDSTNRSILDAYKHFN